MYTGPLIDCDVHHTWSFPSELLTYLSPEWREYAAGVGMTNATVPLQPAFMSYPHSRGFNKRMDSIPANGRVPGSDYETLKAQLLDAHNVQAAILGFDIGEQAGFPNPYFAHDICRAANDWTCEQWLAKDRRLFAGILVPSQLPDAGAAEVKRLSIHPQMAEVLMVVNTLARPFGHPIYHPIYAAAADAGLPIAIHVGGDHLKTGSMPTAGGQPDTRLEFHALVGQATVHHLVSFITHGVFERWPTLKLVIVEAGVAWIPSLLLALDSQYRILKRESPWVRKYPSEYFREHVAVTTQPLELSPRRTQLIELLAGFEGIDDVLCFATDYPHWDADDPLFIAKRIPSAWVDKVMWRNASKHLRLGELRSESAVRPSRHVSPAGASEPEGEPRSIGQA